MIPKRSSIAIRERAESQPIGLQYRSTAVRHSIRRLSSGKVQRQSRLTPHERACVHRPLRCLLLGQVVLRGRGAGTINTTTDVTPDASAPSAISQTPSSGQAGVRGTELPEGSSF